MPARLTGAGSIANFFYLGETYGWYPMFIRKTARMHTRMCFELYTTADGIS